MAPLFVALVPALKCDMKFAVMFETSMSYKMISRLAWSTVWDPASIKKKEEKIVGIIKHAQFFFLQLDLKQQSMPI